MVCVKINNDIKELAKIASFIEVFGENNNLPMPVIFDINLSIDELVTNIISYGYKTNEPRFIEIFMDIIDNNIITKIIDDGIEFDPTKKEDPSIDTPVEKKKIGGLGIYFVRKKMDNMLYKRENGKNILILEKKITK